MPSFPPDISTPSPRIAPRLTQDVMICSKLCIAPKISADGAGTGQNGPHPKRHRKVRCDGATEQKIRSARIVRICAQIFCSAARSQRTNIAQNLTEYLLKY